MPNMKVSPPGRYVLATAAVLTVFLTAAAPAGATNRYASPAGTGIDPTCQNSDPTQACSLPQAVTATSALDDLTLLGGNYPNSPGYLDIPSGVTVHNAPGESVVINSSAPDGISLESDVTLSGVRVNHTGTTLGVAVFGDGATIERDFVTSTGQAACGTNPNPTPTNVLIRDSVCWNTGPPGFADGIGSFAQTKSSLVTIRNVTAVSNHGYAIALDAHDPSNGTFNVTNTIAYGTTDLSGKTDLHVGGGNGTATIAMDHSNYDTVTDADMGGTAFKVTDGGSNVSTPVPAFADAAGGDFHETAASTGTVDLGVAGFAHSVDLGPFDLDGDVRVAGAAPDIGAYEYGSAPPTGGGGGGGGGGPSITPGAAAPTAAPPKKCKKGRKLKRGKCVKKKKKK